MIFFSLYIIGMVKYTGKKRYSSKKIPVFKSKNTAKKSITYKGLSKMMSKVVLRKAEPKDKGYYHGHVELYHNAGSPASGRILGTTWELFTPNRLPAVGTADDQRMGDQIYSKGVSVKMLFGQKQDRMNITYRIVVWKGSTDVKPASLNDLFHWDANNILLDGTNRDRGKVIYQKFIKKNISSQLSTGRELTFTHKFWIPIRKLIRFAGNAGTDFSGDKFYMFIYAYDAYGTLITDNIAYVDVWSKVYYADP